MPQDTEKTAINIAKDCLAVRVRKLNRVISGIYDDCFRPFGLTIAQFNLLIAIRAHKEATPTRLSQSLALEKSTLSRNIDKMRNNGWVEMLPGHDKRSHILRLSPDGEKLLLSVIPAWRQAQTKAEKIIGPASGLINSVQLT